MPIPEERRIEAERRLLEEANVQPGSVNEYIKKKLEAARAAALEKSRTRDSGVQPHIVSVTKNSEQADADRKAAVLYDATAQDIADRINSGEVGKRADPYYYQYYVQLAENSRRRADELDKDPNGVYSVDEYDGAGCIYTATDNYGKNYRVQQNEAFFNGSPANGFLQIPFSEAQPGDIVQDATGGIPGHAMVLNSKSEENGRTRHRYNWSRGGSTPDQYIKDGIYYQAADAEPYRNAFRFVGTPADSLRWRQEWESMQKKNGGKIMPDGIDGGQLNPAIITEKMPTNKVVLHTYYPLDRTYKIGHSSILAHGRYSFKQDTQVSDPGYNIICNNCSDDTMRIVESLAQKRAKPRLITTPGTTRDYVKELWGNTKGYKEYHDRFGRIIRQEFNVPKYMIKHVDDSLSKYQKGGTVSSLWENRTGTSWRDVDKYVSGLKHTAEDNEKLKARILAGEFDKLKAQANNKPTVQSTRKLITVPEFRTEPNRTYYTVQQGDNLSSIAKKNNLTLQQLLKLNSQYKSDPNKIQIGDQVIISSDETADVKRRNIKHLREQEASYKTNLDVILAARHDSNFGVVDKDKQIITVYDKNKNIIARVPINTGASNLDYNTRTYTQGDSRNGKLIPHLGNESTPAGITEITSVSTYHGVPAFQRSRVGNDNKVSKVFDKTTGQWVDDNLSSSMHFEHGVGTGSNRSNGCIRLSTNGAVTLGKYLGVGDRIYTLPQKEGSRFTLKDGNLSFTADNVYGKNKNEEGNSFSYNGKTYDKFDWDDYNVTNNRTYQPLFITSEDTGDKTYNDNVTLFKSSLESNKENLQKQLNLSSAEYNSLAMLAMGIAQQESKFGTSFKYKLKGTKIGIPVPNLSSTTPQLTAPMYTTTTLQNLVKLITGDKSAKSEGIAQIKYGDDKDEIKSLYSKIGVTDNHSDVANEAKSVIARLAHIYKNQYLGDKRLYDAAGMSMEEALAYLYNGGKRSLIAENINDVRNATKLATTSWKNRLLGKKTEVPLLDYSNKVLSGSDKFGYYAEYKSGGTIKKKDDNLVYKYLDSNLSLDSEFKDLFDKKPSYPVQPVQILETTTRSINDTEQEEKVIEKPKEDEIEETAYSGKIYKSSEKQQFQTDMYNAYYKALKEKNMDDIKASEFAKRLTTQDILESNWGQSSLSKVFNFGGVKDFSGNGITKNTVEYINGVKRSMNQNFRVFKNLDDYVNYKVNFVKKWNVYDYSPNAYYSLIVSGPRKYATDPNYTTKLNNLHKRIWE